jgi:signal peptidase I
MDLGGQRYMNGPSEPHERQTNAPAQPGEGQIAIEPSVEPVATPPPAKKKNDSILKDLVVGILIWLFVIFVIGEPREVPSGSMLPTIQLGDRLWTDIIGLRFSPIKRGDILVFTPPIPSTDPFIKRVIGLPGETVAIGDGQVLINGKPIDEPYIAQPPNYVYGPITIPPNKYLMLGDNRNNSTDGHVWGLLDRSQVKSRAIFRFWPLNHMGRLK